MKAVWAFILIVTLVTEWSAPALASTRMEQDVSDLINQSAGAIQIALDRHVYEVANPEAILFRHVERGMDAVESVNQRSPQDLSRALVELTGEPSNALTPAEIADAFQQTRSELRLQLARELAEIHAQDPHANAVVKYLTRTQQRLLNRGHDEDVKNLKKIGLILLDITVCVAIGMSLVSLGLVTFDTACLIALGLAIVLQQGEQWLIQHYSEKGHNTSSVDVEHQTAPWYILSAFDEKNYLDPAKYRDAINSIYIDFTQLKIQRNGLSPNEQERKESTFLERLATFKDRINAMNGNPDAYTGAALINRINAYSLLVKADGAFVRATVKARVQTCKDLTDLQSESKTVTDLVWPFRGNLPPNQQALFPSTAEETTKELLKKFEESISKTLAAVGGCP